LRKKDPRRGATAQIARISNRRAKGIHRGESTQSQLQLITPPSFKPMNKIAKALLKPKPPKEELDTVLRCDERRVT
jgi:hypothetical protein